MYKKRIYFLLLFLPLFVFAQEINKFDAKGKRNGFWQKRYDSGRIRYSGTFVHGKEVGEFLFYKNKMINNYPDIRKIFDENSNKATVTFYDLYGKKKSEGTMIGKNRVGKWKYYDSKGKLVLLENYENNLLNGMRTVFYKNDSIAELSEYKNGKLNGVTTRFSKKGIKLSEMTYQQGLLYGRTNFYEVNGDIKESGLYYKDYKVGKWDFYMNGKYMGFKEPNKKRSHPSNKAILANIKMKTKKTKKYPKLTDAEILENIKRKKEKSITVEKPTDAEILERIKNKKQEKKVYYKATDDEILKNISLKIEAKIKEIKKLEDADILKNIDRKKAQEKKKGIKKLSDEEILENIKRKQKKSER